MDQVRVALAWLKQHHFWVLLVIALGSVVGVWYTGAASLASEFKKQKSTIESEFNSVRGHLNKPFKANPVINEEQGEQIEQMASAVLAEWDKLYNRQKEEVLIWPAELGEDFVNSVQDDDFGDSINSRRREIYQNYIKGTFPSLVKLIDAEELADGASGRTGGRGGPGFGGPGLGPSFGPSSLDGGGRGAATSTDGLPVETYLTEWLDQAELRERLDLEKKPSRRLLQ